MYDKQFPDTTIIHALKQSQQRFGDRSIIEIRKQYTSFHNYLKSTNLKLNLESSDKQLKHYFKLGIKCLSYFDKNYPECLKMIDQPPAIIYYLGNLDLLSRSASKVGIVGSRKATLNSKKLVSKLCKFLSTREDSCIVSGFAKGIDSEAHIKSLEHGNSTIAILGMGLLKAKSGNNYRVYDHLLALSERSLIISEFEPLQVAQKWTYAHRNRLIAAISNSCIVVQAARASGSLITAKYAVQQNKPLFTFAGDFEDPSYTGNQDLLDKNEAIAIYNFEKFSKSAGLKAKKISPTKSQSENIHINKALSVLENNSGDFKDYKNSGVISNLANLSPINTKILHLLTCQSKSFDELKYELDINEVSLATSLSLLEIQGILTRSGSNEYCKASY
jgi:DNA processing protein